MNQILSTESSQKKEIKSKKNKNKTRSRSSNEQPDLVKKAAIVFSILLIIFGAVILTVKLVQIGKEKAKSGIIGELNKPEISVERINADKVNINIKYDEKIAKVSWWWESQKSQMQERNRDVKSVTVDVPDEETNILHIEVIGEDGSKSEHEETVKRDVTTTIERNQIPETDNMEIIAKSKKGIDKIVYYWNDESPTTVPATGNNPKELKTVIELKRGMNTLHIIVTDSEGNTTEKEELLKCLKDPVIDAQINLDQMLLIVTVTHDMGLKEVIFEANGKTVIYDENYEKYDPNRTKIVLQARLQEGIDNKARVEAYSNEQIDDENTTSAIYEGHKDLTDMNTEEE